MLVTASVSAAAEPASGRGGPTERALAKDAELSLSVPDESDAAGRVQALATAAGARLVRGTLQELVLEVPDARYRGLISELRRVGTVRYERVTTRDLGAALEEAAAAIRAGAEARARLERSRALARGVSDELELERALGAEAASSADAARRYAELERRAGVTRVTVRLVAPEPERIDGPRLPFRWLGEVDALRLSDTTTPHDSPRSQASAFIDGQVQLRAEASTGGGALGDGAGAFGLGIGLRSLGAASPVGLYGGFDLALGGGTGFLYRLQPLLGVGAGLGRYVTVGLGAGPGLDGLTGRIPFGVSFPIELSLGLDFIRAVGVTAWARDGWVLASSRREHGAPHAAFGDEASAGLDVLFGERRGPDASVNRAGFRVGLGIREVMGAPMAELSVGVGARQVDF